MPLRNFPFDFSINYTGSRLLEPFGPDRPLYDRATLAAEAATYTNWPALYGKLFLTYIQTPITAVVTLPFSRLSLDQARFSFLAFSNLMLVLAAVSMVWALRPSRLLVAATFVIFATFEPMFDSLRLGQVDALIVLALALAFALLRRGPRWAVGLPLALAAILKLSPVFTILLCAARGWWRTVTAAAIGLAVLAVVSVAVAGWQNNLTFVRDLVPKLMRGSTWYDNISLTGAIIRWQAGPQYWEWEDEAPPLDPAVRVAMTVLNGLIVVAAWWATRRDDEAAFMLSIGVAMLISPVSWSFYPTWLIPALLWLVRRYEDRRDVSRLAMLVALYPLLLVVPAHFGDIDRELYRWPIKTVSLIAFCLLVAWEGLRGYRLRAGLPSAGGARPEPVQPL